MASKFSVFLGELKRRKVGRVAAVYGAVGVAISLGVPDVFGAFGFPGWAAPLVIVIIAIGFPIALIMAWAYEVKPEDPRSLEKELREVDPSPGTPVADSQTDSSPPIVAVDGEKRKSIAVLPFVDMSPNRDQEYFCEGMAEELINALTKVKGLRVAARTSSFYFKGRSEDIREIGRTLDVRTVVEGSVRRAEDRLRVTAQLVSVKDGYHLWSESYDRELRDVFAIQDDISRSIVDTLRPTLLGEDRGEAGEEMRELVVAPTRSLEAYDNYLLGRHYWEGRYEKGLMTALEYFEKAVGIDPDYALPYTGVADSYTVLGLYGYFEPNQARQCARAAIQRAMELDDGISDAHASQGYYHIFLESDWEKGAEALSRAIRLNPDHAKAHAWLGFARVQQARFDEAFEELGIGQRLDPLSSYTISVSATARTMGGDVDTAAEMLEEVLKRDPDYLFAVWLLSWTLCHRPRHEDAVRLGERAAELSGNAAHFRGWVGFLYGVSGMQDRARSILDDLRAQGTSQYVSPLYSAWIHMGLGEEDRALLMLARAIAEGAPFMFLDQDTFYRPLWSTRFAELARKIGTGVVSRAWERVGVGE